jgi:hypothetical protein
VDFERIEKAVKREMDIAHLLYALRHGELTPTEIETAQQIESPDVYIGAIAGGNPAMCPDVQIVAIQFLIQDLNDKIEEIRREHNL